MSGALGDITLNEEILTAALASAPLNERAKLIALIDELRKRHERDFAQENFLAFVQKVWPGFIYGRHHARMAQEFEKVVSGENKRLIINLGPRHAIQIDEPIPTPEGWTTMKNLQVGDLVFGSDGVPTHVIGKSEVFYNRALYRVTTDDGHSLDVDGEHLWTVCIKRGTGVFRDYTTEQLWLRQQGVGVKASRGGGTHIAPSKITAKVRLPTLPQMPVAIHHIKHLPVDPYVLGIWLGNGASAQDHITSHTDDAVHVRAEFERRGYATTDQKTKYVFGTLGLKVALCDLGVLNNKHIPSIYLSAYPTQRRDLLKGLMDSDGNVSKKGQCFFSQKSLSFITQVRELLCSLGIKNSLQTIEAKIYDKSYGVTYRLSFYASDIAYLPRKEERTLKTPPTYGRYIQVEKLNITGNVQCIKVNREDGLFLAGKGYITTHNTKSEFGSYLLPAWFLGKNPTKKIIQCSHTSELAVGFGRKVRNLVSNPLYQEVFPDVDLQTDSKAAGRWNTNAGGNYFAIGVNGAVTGMGADILIIDDPHAFTLDTLVPTTKGFKTIADIAIGDKVFGPDGKPTSVIAKSDVWEDRVVYEVTTDDNVTVECDSGHLWNYRSDTKLSAPYKNSTTKDLTQWVKSSKPCLPRHAAVQYPHKKLLVDPYVLGAWLGDGTTGLGRMTSHPDDMGFMRLQFEQGGYTTNALTDPYSFGVKKLRAGLLAIGVRDSKHIPAEYLTASINQRMALLQGLMDTDGDVTEAGQCSFNNCNKLLAGQFQELIHSLGVKAKLHRYEDKRPNCNPVYRVTYKLKDCCRMPRKNSRTYTPTDKRCRSIVVKETSRRASMQCITVDRTDGLFLVTKAYIVTHNSEQEAAIAAANPEIYDKVYEWYTSGPRQRLQPGGAIIIIQTRWSLRDLSGQVRKKEKDGGGDKWRVVELPAILPSGNPLWPEFWSIEELEATRNAIDVSKWQAQYQQNPTSEEGAIVKREWWKKWEDSNPPPTDFILQTWDTAFEKHNRADYSACITWGVFYHPDDMGVTQANIIMLDAKRDRMEFPKLKEVVLDEYNYWQPDALIIEKKASGAPLIYELRAMGVPVSEFTPTRGNDKISRLNAVADIFASGRVWVPNTRWADEVIEEVASFPAGQHDDYVDCCSMGMARFRKGGFLSLRLDSNDMDQDFSPRQAAYY